MRSWEGLRAAPNAFPRYQSPADGKIIAWIIESFDTCFQFQRNRLHLLKWTNIVTGNFLKVKTKEICVQEASMLKKIV